MRMASCHRTNRTSPLFLTRHLGIDSDTFGPIVRVGERPSASAPAALILVDAEESDSVQLRQLWDEDAQEGSGVDEKVCRVVLCVETCQEVSAEGSRGRRQRKVVDALHLILEAAELFSRKY